ncbi:putative PIN family toxin of toxin-antitoxin system [Arcicella aurantiaca]|uniref:Putative PIN family toxin of toxin-antitoxin system n=1 Tax=Arcicella aurantiaca TaxID=591202 RepID=A0A316DDK1_9BACT|nr:putative toxin-antitoxin system toxin component, PIN family [Arcicella aurantiaca]PWK16094.1 putative PIN family toxin of toxin-antitoxin system [Arcicella aurantiaca]
MKVVIDTHGILNAVSSHSPHKWLYDAFMDEQFIWVASNEIISEYSEIIGRNFGLRVSTFVLESLINAENFQKFEPNYKWQLVETDPDDDKFVDCAVGVNADYLVSDDKHVRKLLTIKNLFPPVPIVTFQEFKIILER